MRVKRIVFCVGLLFGWAGSASACCGEGRGFHPFRGLFRHGCGERHVFKMKIVQRHHGFTEYPAPCASCPMPAPPVCPSGQCPAPLPSPPPAPPTKSMPDAPPVAPPTPPPPGGFSR